MTDRDLDRQLANALDVTPSAEFLARLRSRISEEPPAAGALPSLSRPRWATAAGLLAAAGLLLAVVLRVQSPSVPPEQPVQAARDIQLSRSEPTLPVSAVPTGEAPDRHLEHRPTMSAVRRPDPEVLVSPGEMAGVRLLLAATQDDRLIAALGATRTSTFADTIPVPDDIVLAPVTIEPLNQPSH